MYGYVVMASRVQPRNVAEVRAAAAKAGIALDCVKDIKDFNAFKRAVHGLVRRGIAEEVKRSKLLDNEDCVSFQLSIKWLERHGVKYETVDVVTFHKDSGALACRDDETKRILQNLLRKYRLIASTTDIHRVIYRHVDNLVRKVLIKDSVYYLPSGHEKIIAQARTYYEILGADFWAYPITATAEIPCIRRAISDDMDTVVHDLKVRLERSANGITPLVAVNALLELQTLAKQYRECAECLFCTLEEVAETESGKIVVGAQYTAHELCGMIKTGRRWPHLAEQLAHAAARREDGVAASV